MNVGVVGMVVLYDPTWLNNALSQPIVYKPLKFRFLRVVCVVPLVWWGFSGRTEISTNIRIQVMRCTQNDRHIKIQNHQILYVYIYKYSYILYISLSLYIYILLYIYTILITIHNNEASELSSRIPTLRPPPSLFGLCVWFRFHGGRFLIVSRFQQLRIQVMS
jgi:hypothetical protein